MRCDNILVLKQGLTHCVTIEEESETSDQHDNPLEALPVDSLVDLSHADISILKPNYEQLACPVVPSLHTCSWSKSLARSVLYNRAWNLPIVNIRRLKDG